MENVSLEMLNKNVEDLKNQAQKLAEQIKDVRANSLIISKVSSSFFHMQFKMSCIDTTLDNIERKLMSMSAQKQENIQDNIYYLNNDNEPKESKSPNMKESEIKRIVDILEQYEKRIYKLEKYLCKIEK